MGKKPQIILVQFDSNYEHFLKLSGNEFNSHFDQWFSEKFKEDHLLLLGLSWLRILIVTMTKKIKAF